MKKEYSDIGGIQQQAADIIRQAYDKGYKAGHKDGYHIGEIDGIMKVKLDEFSYQRGLNDAWDATRKIDTNRDLENYVFGEDLEHGFINISVSEAIAKIKEYEKKQIKKSCGTCKKNNKCLSITGCCDEYEPKQTDDEIKVGDEVISDAFDDKGIVTYITKDGVNCVSIILSGSSMMKVKLSGLRKTGRHFPQIAEVLDQMKEGEQE